MSKKRASTSKQSASNAFVTFWTTLPGILTGVAALLTAVAGLYLAFAPRKNINGGGLPPSPTPYISPTVEAGSGNCFEQEFAKVAPVEVGSGEQILTSKDGVIRIKLTDNHLPVGAFRLKFYRVGGYFEIEEVLDSKCKPVEGLFNLSQQTPVDVNNKPKNDDTLQIPLGGNEYSLRLSFHGGNFSANFKKL